MAPQELWNIAKKESWKTEEPCPVKTETCSVHTKPCMKKTFSAVGCGRKVKKEERETLNKEAIEEESKSGKQRCREKGKGLKWFEVFCPASEVGSVGNSSSFSVCLLVVPPSLLVVTVPFSNVNVVCEVVFSDSNCEYVEPQTFSLSRNRETRVALECETYHAANFTFSKRHQKVCEAEYRRHQKGRFCKSDRHGQENQRNHQLRRRRWRWTITILLGLHAKEWFSTKWRNILNRAKASRWKSVSWSISCLDQKIQMSASRLSQKTPGTKEAVASSCCSTHLEAKEQAEALKWLMQRVLPKQQGK